MNDTDKIKMVVAYIEGVIGGNKYIASLDVKAFYNFCEKIGISLDTNK